MKKPVFERNKILRLIRTYGDKYLFKQDILDDLKEPSGDAKSIAVNGLFHQTVSHVTVLAQESASVQTKQNPFILAMYEDGSKVKQDDTVIVGNTLYRVTGVTDINNWGIAVEISMEVVLNGR